VLRTGDIVPADLRLVQARGLLLDRSALTGESLPGEASLEADPLDAPLIDRRAIACSGSAVVSGHGEGLVVATGPRTELGKIAGALTSVVRPRSYLQRELDRLVRILLTVAVALVAITVSLNLIRGATLGAAVLAGISAAIAAIPEEPPVLLAVILGLGAYRLLRRGVLVRRLNAQEILGSVDLIVTDKTGTLTENRLALVAVVDAGGLVTGPERRLEILGSALRAEADAWLGAADERRGSFTRALEAALGDAAPSLSPGDLLASASPSAEAPYSSTRARRDGAIEDLALGAPEHVLALCGAGAAATWSDLVEAHAAAGRRLLLLARRPAGDAWQPLALVAFADRLREDIPRALADARGAGIQVVVVTGDHPTTARIIASAAGLADGETITGEQLEDLSDEEVLRRLPGLAVVARATPTQKLRLVLLARGAGRTVAVTGDGVNDAPALQRSDVGVAMGSGTSVAREAADLVLGDDSFVTLMEGLREGRRIVANVQKGLVFLTSTHVALLGFVLIATVAGFGQPLLPLQILWLELFIDLSASVAFEREPAEPDIMRQPPRPRSVPVLTQALLAKIGLAGSVTALAALALISFGGPDLDHARWLAFSALVMGQLVRAYANRSLTHSIGSLRPNRVLAAACLGGALLHLLIPYVPPLAEAFRASPLGLAELILVIAVALVPAAFAQVVRVRRSVAWVA